MSAAATARRLLAALLGAAAAAPAQVPVPAQAQGAAAAAPKPAAGPGVYRVLVACESADEVWRVAFDGARAWTEKVVEVGYQPTEIEGPHGLTVAPDGRHWFLSVAHGKPFGLLYKYRTEDDELVGECELGMFPATMQISRATGLLYCVNFNLHGRMLPSTVSIVDPDAMVEAHRTVTGAMPHGSRLSPDGMKHYSCAMMSGQLFEIDAAKFEVLRDLQLDAEPPRGHASVARPTWVQPHPGGDTVWCALNGAATLAEVDLDRWVVTRRLQTGKGPYNLDIAPDGRRLVASYKTAGAIGVWDVGKGLELERLPSTASVTHGVVISPDGKYAFVTAEGRNDEPGSVDVVDLDAVAIVASLPAGLQAGGIAFLGHDAQ